MLKWIWGCWLLMPLFDLMAAPSRTLTVASSEWPPFIMVDGQGRMSGIDIDLIQALERHTGLQFIVKIYPWGRVLRYAEVGEIDMVFSIAKTLERERYVEYLSPPYIACPPAFYARPDLAGQIRNYQDLGAHQVGYVLKSAHFARFDNDEQLDKHGVPTETQLLGMLMRDHLQVMVSGSCHMDYILSRHNPAGLVKTTYRPPEQEGVYLAMSRLSPHKALGVKIEQALAETVKSGELARIVARYYPPMATVPVLPATSP
jgi:polar amino acid transport system substrate-binding protein